MNTPRAVVWDQRYRSEDCGLPPPSVVLAENAHLLPDSGTALELACGRGGNALFLARRGLTVTARDISAGAMESLRAHACAEAISLSVEVADIERLPWPPGLFDIIVVTRYLHRALVPAITGSLNPQGLLFYQTFTASKPAGIGPANPDYLLGENELLHLFRELSVRYYREDAACGDCSLGRRAEAYFIGQKRPSPLSSPRPSA